MLMYFLPTAIRCGGTGVGTGDSTDQVGDSGSMDLTGVSDGVHPGIAAGILHIGMADIGVVTGDQVIGDRDGIITITILIMAGLVLLIITITVAKVYAMLALLLPHTVGLLIIEDVLEDVWWLEAAMQTHRYAAMGYV